MPQVLVDLSDDDGSMSASQIADISRNDKSKWRKNRNGTRGGTIQGDATCSNWYHPFLWYHINQAAIQNSFSPSATAKQLKQDHPLLFKHLHKGTLNQWRKKGRKEWSEVTLENVKCHRALDGSGHVGFLSAYPEVVETAKKQMISLRKAGVPLTTVVGRAIILAAIELKKPDLLSSNNKFKCSKVWTNDP